MAKGTKSVDDMLDYVRHIRRHTKGCRSIHVRLSVLEKHFREEHYRRFVAVTFRPLIANFEATMFALPNYDVVLMVKGASVDVIDNHLINIRKKYRESAIVSAIDAVQGTSDTFVEWFDLEADFSTFREYIQTLATELKKSVERASKKTEDAPAIQKRSPGLLQINSRSPERLKPAGSLKRVPVTETETNDGQCRELDVDMLHSVTRALQSTDVGTMVRKQRVMAILGVHAPQPVMMHRFIPAQVAFDTLLQAEIATSDRWLEGYFAEYLSGRMLLAVPDMRNEQSLISSMQVSAAGICDEMFDVFDQKLGGHPRSSIVLEFGATELAANFPQFQMAWEKVTSLGYKISIGGIDPRILLWMDYTNLKADFVKLRCPVEPVDTWLTDDIEQQLRDRIQEIGIARIIWDGCSKKADIEVGQRLGVTLFQGNAVDPILAC